RRSRDLPAQERRSHRVLREARRQRAHGERRRAAWRHRSDPPAQRRHERARRHHRHHGTRHRGTILTELVMKVRDHLLEGVRFERTENMGGEITPEYLVIHYTVVTTAAGVVGAFKNPAIQASAHLVLDLDGTFIQMVPFNRKAWHAGKSQWAGRS